MEQSNNEKIKRVTRQMVASITKYLETYPEDIPQIGKYLPKILETMISGKNNYEIITDIYQACGRLNAARKEANKESQESFVPGYEETTTSVQKEPDLVTEASITEPPEDPVLENGSDPYYYDEETMEKLDRIKEFVKDRPAAIYDISYLSGLNPDTIVNAYTNPAGGYATREEIDAVFNACAQTLNARTELAVGKQKYADRLN